MPNEFKARNGIITPVVQVNTGGTQSAPSISNSNDPDTGIFFPAPDTLAFAEGGTEILRISSTGAIGLSGTNYGNSGQVLTSNGSGSAPTWQTVTGGGSSSWSVKTSNYTAANGDRIIANTSGGVFTITLPSSPATGNSIQITDGGDWNTNNLIIARNGSTIENTADDLTVDIGGITIDLIYTGTTWQVTATTGKEGPPGASNVARAVSAGVTTGTITPNSNTTDILNVFGLTGTITFAQPSGSPPDGQRLVIRIKDNGTARGINWTTSSGAFRAVGVTLPTTTVVNKLTYVGCVYNSTDNFWDVIASVTQL